MVVSAGLFSTAFDKFDKKDFPAHTYSPAKKSSKFVLYNVRSAANTLMRMLYFPVPFEIAFLGSPQAPLFGALQPPLPAYIQLSGEGVSDCRQSKHPVSACVT